MWQREFFHLAGCVLATREAALWKQEAVNNQRKHSAEVQAFREELERSTWDELMVYDWARGEFPPCALSVPVYPVVPVLANAITQADIDVELRRVGRESGDGE